MPCPSASVPSEKRQAIRTIAVLGAFCAALLLAVGCATRASRVDHLPLERLSLNAPETIEMRHFVFQYTMLPVDGGYRVQATAWRKESMPGWAEYVTTGWFAAYLARPDGTLLARDQESLYRGYFIPSWYDEPIELDFFLPRPVQPGPLSIAFGYDLTISDTRGGSIFGAARPLSSENLYFTARETAR